jgi:16S rRNA (guanine(966)-N(2))-methyltransferase RsmD
VPAEGVRPTPDRVRESIFNILGQNLEDVHFLDLFAGTGAVGLEAASRGASRVDLVEWDPMAASTCQKNIDRLGVGSTVRLVRADVAPAIDSYGARQERFDVIFADPPYTDPHENLVGLVRRIDRHALIADEGQFVLQMHRGRPLPASDHLVVTKTRDYGITSIVLFERRT